MTIVEKAKELRSQGFTCSQSVFAAGSEEIGLDKDTALALAGGLGAGVRSGEICGALLGAAMAISKLNPYVVGDNAEQRAVVSQAIEKLTGDFKVQFGCLRCQDLGTHGPECDPLVAWCAQAVQDAVDGKK